MASSQAGVLTNRFVQMIVKPPSWLVYSILAGPSVLTYLIASHFTYRLGYPLDDAWIHQTYARNLVMTGEWAFMPGHPSAGSTAPLWSFILAVGYLLETNHFLWSSLWGGIGLASLGMLSAKAFMALLPDRKDWAPWVGTFMIFEWHLAWAASSGMETSLYSALALLVITHLVTGSSRWLLLGGLIGLAAWLRPEGSTLILPVSMVILFQERSWILRLMALIRHITGMAVILAPYLFFNHSISGTWWPNTYYAKQAEYAIELYEPVLDRILEQFMLPMVGVGFLLLPGFLIMIVSAWKYRRWAVLAAASWAIGVALLFAMRLPVTYHHGRYLIPVMPVYFLLGLTGSIGIVKFSSRLVWERVIGKIWLLSTTVVLMIFWILGARAYGRDVAFIESEMVAVALWVSEHTEDDALIATHDIGALGYFSNRSLLDLAGLVSPDVIPFIRDETRLRAYLNANDADYLVTFPGWYPELVSYTQPVFNTNGRFSPLLGGENMVVYRWEAGPDD